MADQKLPFNLHRQPNNITASTVNMKFSGSSLCWSMRQRLENILSLLAYNYVDSNLLSLFAVFIPHFGNAIQVKMISTLSLISECFVPDYYD